MLPTACAGKEYQLKNVSVCAIASITRRGPSQPLIQALAALPTGCAGTTQIAEAAGGSGEQWMVGGLAHGKSSSQWCQWYHEFLPWIRSKLTVGCQHMAMQAHRHPVLAKVPRALENLHFLEMTHP